MVPISKLIASTINNDTHGDVEYRPFTTLALVVGWEGDDDDDDDNGDYDYAPAA